MATRGEAASAAAPSGLGLRRDAIGLREVLFQSITNMAPGAAIAAAIPAGAPVVAMFVIFLITVAVTLGLGLADNPVNAFAMVGTGIVIVIVAVYIMADAACVGYFASSANRGPGRRWNPLLHLIIPLLGIAAFVPAWLTAAGIRAFSFIAPLTPPSSYMGPGVAGFMFVGVIYLLYLYARHPQRVTEVGLVHVEAPEPQAEAGVSR